MDRPKTQLFMLMSADGKISTGDRDVLDFDQDLPKIKGVKEGLTQYYAIEKTTYLHSFNTGRVMAKIGMNTPGKKIKKLNVNFIIVDDEHLNLTGVDNMLKWSKILYFVTDNKNHPVFKRKNDRNLKIIFYPTKVDLSDLFRKLKCEFAVKRITLQSGGTMNAALLRAGLVDQLSLVIAPILIGGKDTSTLVDGESLHSLNELSKIRPLKLLKVNKLKDNYLHLVYKVLN